MRPTRKRIRACGNTCAYCGSHAALYDLQLQYTPEEQAGKVNDNGVADAPPVIYQAMREQLGLKLTPAKDLVTNNRRRQDQRTGSELALAAPMLE